VRCVQVMPIFDKVAKDLAAEEMGTQEAVPDIQVGMIFVPCQRTELQQAHVCVGVRVSGCAGHPGGHDMCALLED